MYDFLPWNDGVRAGGLCETGRVHAALWIVVLVATVTVVTGAARRSPVPAPLLLTLVGLGASYIPSIPEVELTPDLVLIGFLPPLLYAAALETSLVDFRANRRPIALLSVGLVIVNTIVVGLVAWWVLPIPAAPAFALGAVVAPPDAVAATAIARRVGMPRRMVTILQGESLVNDATALVALRTAIVAAAGTISIWEIGLRFVVVAAGGVAAGVAVAFVTGKLRRQIDDEVLDTAVSFVTPFIAYLLAEELGASGVLAVVVTGLILGHKSHLMQSASSRVFERTNWASVQFMLENTVFLLIGLQVRSILDNAANNSLSTGRIALACVAVTVTTMLVRPLWVFPATYLPRLIPSVRAVDPFPPWTVPAAISWAGMRGVVTLAAAFILPADTPQRDVLILIALVVVGATLLIQGSSLPWWLRRLGLSGPDPGEDALQAASVAQRAASAGLRRLAELRTDADSEAVIERLERRSNERAEAMWEQLGSAAETPSQAFARLRIAMIEAERRELIDLRDQGLVPDEVMRRVIAAIDIEETVLDLGRTWSGEDRDTVLRSPVVGGGCEHLERVVQTPAPRTPNGCEECLRDGLEWVHLRLCLTCGHVGCCNSSVGRHADAHFVETDHPVMRSFEPGEGWRWCFVDELLG
ncbi:MAG: Na+/H+ antiporter [Nocardioidaceae bacterium]